MAVRHDAVIEEVLWNDVKDEVKPINKELYEIIENLRPTKNLTLFKASYPYGTKICDYGTFSIPCKDGSIASINDKKTPKNIQDKLHYNPLPVALVLHNNVEVFSELDNRFVPIETFKPGAIFGTWEIFDSPQQKEQTRDWSFSAGVRSIFMLPKIANDNCHRKLLAKYKAIPPSPKYLADQYDVFKSIANHPSFEEQWRSEILFFPIEWISKSEFMVNNNNWIAFRYLLLKEAWKYSSNWRYQLSIDLIWRSLTLEIDKKNMRTRPYLVDTIKHLISIAIGTALGFCPATNSNSAPIGGMQDVYINNYGLKEYIPTIMEPCYLRDYNKPVYYSLQHPTLLAYPQNSGFRSTMKDLQDIQYLMDTLLSKLEKENLSIYKLIEHVKFDYFHSESNKYGYNVKLTADIPRQDDRFMKICGHSKVEGMSFANAASFLRGCIRMTKVKS